MAGCLQTMKGGSGGSEGARQASDCEGYGLGSGLNITEYQFNYFSLSPGEGGEYYGVPGGGGGILVDQRGPEPSEGRGGGYGAGGSGFAANSAGSTGVVLIEVVPRTTNTTLS